jgi:hypothetical protein
LAWIEALQPPAMPEHAPQHVYVSLEEILQLAALPIPSDNLPLLRDQASALLLFVSGARDGAFTSLPLAAVDLGRRQIHQLPFEFGVRTKGGKAATTTLLDIPEVMPVIEKWDRPVGRIHTFSGSPWGGAQQQYCHADAAALCEGQFAV